jgi:hypothetical protein
MAKAHRIHCLAGCLAFVGVSVLAVTGSAVAAAVPYPLPPGYLSSYDMGYDAMSSEVGSKYHFTPTSELSASCQDELRIARSKNPPESADGFVAGCIDAARHAMGIYYACDRNGDDPVCPRRP